MQKELELQRNYCKKLTKIRFFKQISKYYPFYGPEFPTNNNFAISVAFYKWGIISKLP